MADVDGKRIMDIYYGLRCMDIRQFMELYYVRMMMDNILIWCWVLADCYVIDDICLGIVVMYFWNVILGKNSILFND